MFFEVCPRSHAASARLLTRPSVGVCRLHALQARDRGAAALLAPGPAQGAVPRDAEGAGQRAHGGELEAPPDELHIPRGEPLASVVPLRVLMRVQVRVPLNTARGCALARVGGGDN